MIHIPIHGDMMKTSTRNEVDSKQEVVFIMVSPLYSEMEDDFVRDDREHLVQIHHNAPFSPIHNEL